MRRKTLPAALLAVLAVATMGGAARAQADDWGVKRNPFDKQIVDRYKGLLEKDPGDAVALKKLMDLYGQYSTVDKLIGEYEGRLQKKPDSWPLAMILGNLYRRRPNVDKALEMYEQAGKNRPDDPAAHIARAEIYRQKRQPTDAAAAYEKALPLSKSGKEKKAILRSLADLALDAGDMGKARGWYQKYIELDPADTAARLELAEALSKHNLHEDALKEYQAAASRLATDPAKRVEVLARIGGEQDALGKPDEAIATYRQAMEMTQKGHYLRKELTERIIDIYRKKQDLRGLVAYYEKAWPAGSRGYFEWDIMARLYEENGEQDKALDAYRKAVHASPYELDTQRRLIALLIRAGKDEEVMRQYEAVIAVAPGEPRFQLELAERYYYSKQGGKAKALALLRQIASRFPDDPGVHAALADLYARWGEEKQALHEYEILVRIEPNDDSHLVNLGEQYFQKGDKAKAIEIWKRIAAAKTPEAFARLAEVYAEHDMGPEAIDMYAKAIGLRPKDPALHRGLAGVFERLRDDRALGEWQAVMDLTTGDPAQKATRREARTRIIAILFRKSGQPLLAKTREWQRAFDRTPPDLEAGYFLAEAYLKLGRYEDAERALKRVLALNPKDLDAKHQLVAVFKSERKLEEAIELLKELANDQPGLERQYYTQIAELELQLYKDDEAIAYAQKALEKSPTDAQAQERLAEIHAKRGDHAKAIEAYKRAIELGPHNYKVHFALARLYLLSGQKSDAAEAARLYRDIIRHATDDDTIRLAGKRAIDLEEYLGSLGELEQEMAPLAFQIGGKQTYRRILVEIYDRYVPPLVQRARAGDDAAAKELARLGEHGLKPLLEALGDVSDPAQQRVAVRVLGYLGNKDAAPPLVKLALEAPEARQAALPSRLGLPDTGGVEMDVRVEALVAAGRLGDPRVIPQLIQLAGHREVALREAAAWALGQTHNAKAAPTLLAALGDSRSSVQSLACLGLAHTGDRRALDRAAEVLRDKKRAVETRSACAYTLGLARSPAYVPVLAEVVGEANDDVQVKAAWALGRIGDARARGPLIRAYWQRKGAVRDAVVWALAHLGGGDPAPVRSEDVALETGKIDYRSLLHGLTADLGGAAGIDPALLRGQSQDLSEGLAGGLGDASQLDRLIRVLGDLVGRDDDGIMQALAGLGPQIGDRLDPLCEHDNAEVRALALAALARLKDARAPARIGKALDDETLSVRVSALASAERYLRQGGAGAAALVPVVAGHLGAGAWQERTAAADALSGMGKVVPATALISALADASPFVRQAAARALGKLRLKEGVPPLIEATSDEVAAVRLDVVQALGALADPRASARLAEMARKDPDPRVRAAAGKP